MNFLIEQIEQNSKNGKVKRYRLDGNAVRKERMKKNLTVRAVAHAIGISAGYIREVELNLKKSCNEKIYFKLLEYYDVIS